jgi:hypothetical protein
MNDLFPEHFLAGYNPTQTKTKQNKNLFKNVTYHLTVVLISIFIKVKHLKYVY